ISFKKEQSIKGCVKVANFPYLKEIRMLYFVVRQEWVKQTSLDELGYQRMDVDSANLFFNLIAKRYKKLSTIITTNSPFSKWADKW
ncbi:MAG: ATP-binding protein, partial [Oscillospiraceae bacterium]